jgi:hypothetical protein
LNDIQVGIFHLFEGLGEVVELRIPKAGRHKTISGCFDDFEALAVAIAEHSGAEGIPAVYYTLNPVSRDLLARSANRTKNYATETPKTSTSHRGVGC